MNQYWQAKEPGGDWINVPVAIIENLRACGFTIRSPGAQLAQKVAA